MSVKNFKFVSPGVFINEIDNSFIPKTPQAIGPVIVGRSRRGLAMQPIKVESFSEFVEVFGDTVPGFGGGDIYRNGNYQSPMYGTYAAKAFLRPNVAPIHYLRLLGQQDTNNDGTAVGTAGWQTVKNPGTSSGENGGAYGLWFFPTGNQSTNMQVGTGSLAAIFYLNKSCSIVLTGVVGPNPATAHHAAGISKFINTDSNNLLAIIVSGAQGGQETVKFSLDDSADTFIRKAFNTNPQLVGTPGEFYSTASAKDYWLGETYEQFFRDNSCVGVAGAGVISPIAYNGGLGVTTGAGIGPHKMKQASREAIAGWFVGQDVSNNTASYTADTQQKLFRLKGRGHGEWLHKSCKVSIDKIRQATSNATEYGTFSVVIRNIADSDNAVEVMERFDNLTLDPTSPDFISRRMGDQFYQWDTSAKRLKLYGEYPNRSKYVRVDMNSNVEAGATDAALLPFGYLGPPKWADALHVTGNYDDGDIKNRFIYTPNPSLVSQSVPTLSAVISGSHSSAAITQGAKSGSMLFPVVRLRQSASDGGISDQTEAYFGMSTTRTSTDTRFDVSVPDFHRIPYHGFPDDPTSYAGQIPSGLSGVMAYSYAFSLDELKTVDGVRVYVSGTRAAGNGSSYTTTLNAGYNRFTAPFWGGLDGWDITKSDPLYNRGMSSTSTDLNNYIYHTIKRGIDTVADPEFIDMNLITAPGVTLDKLTTHMINTCEERADALALIDLANVYIPAHERFYSSKTSRIGTDPTSAANALKDRRIDSSYGCTFYPWVQTRDEDTGQLVWVPPSVAMMGVLASSEAKSELWFAPAGFNRGGLTEGAAGIPVVSVSERLTSKERDTLYEGRINPIASFPSSGIVVFGQKTLQERRSALDRINVRRLVIYLKKQISILSTQILFEQNVDSTWMRFKGLIEPLLANVKSKFGITDYRLILDETTTTPDLIDQNILYAKIMVKPARAIEFIAIDFVIASTGASFDD